MEVEIRPTSSGGWSWQITEPAPLNENERPELLDLDTGRIAYNHRSAGCLSYGKARTRRAARKKVDHSLKRIASMRGHHAQPPEKFKVRLVPETPDAE